MPRPLPTRRRTALRPVALLLGLAALAAAPVVVPAASAQVVIRERVEVAPAPPESVARLTMEGAFLTEDGGADGLALDPADYGPITRYRILYADRVMIGSIYVYGQNPNQPIVGTVEVYDRLADDAVVATAPLMGGFDITRTGDIGDFNGSGCGGTRWYETFFEPRPDIELIRHPEGPSINLATRTTIESGRCNRPNSIVPWCECALAAEEDVKGHRGIHLRARREYAVADRLLVTADPDTLGAGTDSEITVRVGDGYGYEIDFSRAGGFNAATPVTLTAPATLGSATGGGLTVGGSPPELSVTVPYADARAGAVHYAAPDSSLLYDTPVPVTAAGGGLSGSGLVVVLGRDGAGPDSLDVSLGDPDVDCGDSTRVSVRGLLGGADRALPDGTGLRLVVRDSVHSEVAWGDSTGARLIAPVEAIRDGRVWVRTKECSGLGGPVPLGVYAEVVGPYWDEDGDVSGEGETTLSPGSSADALVVWVGAAALGPGESAPVSVEAADGAAPLDDGDLVDLRLDEEAALGALLDTRTGQQGAALNGVDIGALRGGHVEFVAADGAGRPPALAAALSSSPAGEQEREAPGAEPRSDAAPGEPGGGESPFFGRGAVSAALTSDPSVSGSAEVAVQKASVEVLFLRQRPDGTYAEGNPIPLGPDPDGTARTVGVYLRAVGTDGSPLALSDETPLDIEIREGDELGEFIYGMTLSGDRLGAVPYGEVRQGGGAAGASRVTYVANGVDAGTLPAEDRYARVTVTEPGSAPAVGHGFLAFGEIPRPPSGPIEIALSEAEVWPHVPSSTMSSHYARVGLDDLDDTVNEVTIKVQGVEGPVAGSEVTVRAEWVEGSGGHTHDGNASPTMPRSLAGVLTDLETEHERTGEVTVVTDEAGRARVRYRATEFGGRVRLHAAATVDGAEVEAGAEVAVRVPGLVLLPESADYIKVGGTPNHRGANDRGYDWTTDDNHWVHPSVRTSLVQIARTWQAEYPDQAPLAINDLSLPMGGRFHIGRWEDYSHQSHRFGRDADIRTTRSLRSRRGILLTLRRGVYANKEFERTCQRVGATRADIHSYGKPGEHYHVYFYQP
jgi:hypothetical protein